MLNQIVAGCRALPGALSLALCSLTVLAAEPLGLREAEQITLGSDPEVTQFKASSAALAERSVAAAQLPDPRLRFGAANLPVDTFDLDQEPMTQLVVGVQQQFPSGRSRQLTGEALASRSSAMRERASAQQLQSLMEMRTVFLELIYQQLALAVLDEARQAVSELTEVTRDYYATGRAQQQDVIGTELELSKLDERIARIHQARDELRAQLGYWLGHAAERPMDTDLPKLPQPPTQAFILQGLERHPILLAHQSELSAARVEVEAAGEHYKPGWMLDLSYGDRSGRSATGVARPDFFSAMVSVELPLFTAKRQDRRVAAAIESENAADARYQQTLRQMQRVARTQQARREHISQRLTLYNQRLLPVAEANSQSAEAAYQAGVGDFTDVLRSKITEYELKLQYLRARIDRLIAEATLLYLAGESS